MGGGENVPGIPGACATHNFTYLARGPWFPASPFWKFDTVDPTSPWFTRSCLKSHEWTLAKLGTTVHDSIFEVLITGSLSSQYSWLPTAMFYLHRGASYIGSCWHVFSGRAALGLSFRERKRRNDQICLFSSEANILLTHGSRPRYF